MVVLDASQNIIFNKVVGLKGRSLTSSEETWAHNDKYELSHYYIEGNVLYYIVENDLGVCDDDGKTTGAEYKATFKNNKVTIEKLDEHEFSVDGVCI